MGRKLELSSLKYDALIVTAELCENRANVSAGHLRDQSDDDMYLRNHKNKKFKEEELPEVEEGAKLRTE